MKSNRHITKPALAQLDAIIQGIGLLQALTALPGSFLGNTAGNLNTVVLMFTNVITFLTNVVGLLDDIGNLQAPE